MVTEELWVRWDLIQEDLGHLQRALQTGGGDTRQSANTKKQRDEERESKEGLEEGKRGSVLTASEQRRNKKTPHSYWGK